MPVTERIKIIERERERRKENDGMRDARRRGVNRDHRARGFDRRAFSAFLLMRYNAHVDIYIHTCKYMYVYTYKRMLHESAESAL